MSFFKIDLQEDAWLDQVFQTRNKAYGAFQIRKSYSQNSLFGLGIALASFTLLLSLPLLIRAKGEEKSGTIISNFPIIDLTEIKKQPLEVKKEIPKVLKNTIKNLPPVITIDKEVPKKVIPPSALDLEGKNSGSKTIQGKDTTSLDIPDEPQTGTKDVPDDGKEIFISAEQGAEYPGGFGALSADVSKYLRGHYPQGAVENGISGKVVLNFVVEKDGSIDLIKIISGKDLGGGIPEAAIKAVEQLKKFHPGKQNGHPVRQYFSFPISFEIQNSDQ